MKRWIHASSDLDKKYKGIWFGASKNPITVQELLDKIIAKDGRGFTVMRKTKYSGDNLLSDGSVEVYLMDEERRGKLKLSVESIQYLIDNLPDSNWIKEKLIEYSEDKS